MQTILKESAEARKLSVAVQSLDYGADVGDQLKKYGESMEKTYAVLQALLSAENPSKTKIMTLTEACEKKRGSFEKAKVGFCFSFPVPCVLLTLQAAAKGFMNGMKKKKGKAKSKATAKAKTRGEAPS